VDKNAQNKLLQFSPYVRRAWNHRVSEMKMKPRIIFDYELLYMEKGELSLRIEDDVYTIVPGDIVLFKPGKEHEFLGSSGESWMPHIHFDMFYDDDSEDLPINFKPRRECSEEELRMIRQNVLGTVLNIPDVIRISNHGEIFSTLQGLIHAYDRRDPDFTILQKSLVLRIIYHLVKPFRRKPSTYCQTIKTKSMNTVSMDKRFTFYSAKAYWILSWQKIFKSWAVR
jgi:hypothetical protein